MAGMLKTSKETKLPEIHPGDIVRVHQKIKEGGKERIQVFEGIVIKTHGKQGSNATFTVRKIAYGVGVEKTYPLCSPSIVKIEFKKSSDVRRAKLYYLRKLSGKSLKMKEKKVDRDVWELVAKTEEPEDLSEEVLAEAVQAEEERKKVEESQTAAAEVSRPEGESEAPQVAVEAETATEDSESKEATISTAEIPESGTVEAGDEVGEAEQNPES